jgi:hypothetical protein
MQKLIASAVIPASQAATPLAGEPVSASQRLKKLFSYVLFPMVTTALLGLTGCANQGGSLSLQGKPLSGHVRMTQVQAAYLGSGNAGSGVLEYQGSRYPFSFGGLGIGGIGVSKIEARGEVYG